MIAELGAGARPLLCKVYKQTYWAGLKFDNKKAMTDNARHGEHQTLLAYHTYGREQKNPLP